ncbi:hypothetical protein IV38_GL000709 [Lactobacillus selangorensis]|uniref:Glycosyltransferase n=1 Tax=Lactobacillus selangorensis TaxID=81857 RepID=A0A0R2FTW7_9LACO|nr:glycosyltransferase [Lactobacillus selangorensis]KRN27217.1 hypothetical protein IV38_GL000709 [Lactobacillus selangorensis]KRN29861.1 hypothetical protein IV40_GL000569 [Lactobacillus selangorensis]
MKVLHINAGNETGGGRTHIIGLLKALNQQPDMDAQLLVYEDGPVAASARDAGIPVHVLAQQGKFDASVLKRTVQYINDNHFDVVHTHGPRVNLYLSVIKKWVHAKWVLTLHTLPKVDYLNKGLFGKILYPISTWTLSQPDEVFLITRRYKPFLLSHGVPAKKIRVIFNGLEFSDTFTPAQKQPEFTLVNVARLTAQKNPRLLIEAANELDFDFKLHMVGDGELQAPMEKLVQQYGLEDKVIFDGFQTNVKPFYQHADVSVLSSISEGFPTVLLESADNGVPAISTDVGGVPDIIARPEFGWLVANQDQQGLVRAMKAAHVAWARNQLTGMGIQFHDYAKEHFSTTRLATNVRSLYTALLQGK